MFKPWEQIQSRPSILVLYIWRPFWLFLWINFLQGGFIAIKTVLYQRQIEVGCFHTIITCYTNNILMLHKTISTGPFPLCYFFYYFCFVYGALPFHSATNTSLYLLVAWVYFTILIYIFFTQATCLVVSIAAQFFTKLKKYPSTFILLLPIYHILYKPKRRIAKRVK